MHTYPWARILVRACLALLALATVLLLGQPASATGVVYVVPGGAGTQSGASWANARDLAAALTAANSGDELWVKAGTYKPTTTTDRTATFALKTGVALYGGFAGAETGRSQRNWTTNVTILSGDIGTVNNTSDNSYHVVVGSGVDSTAVLDGFTITGGSADAPLSELSADHDGGGMYNINSSPTLTNVTFSDNYGTFGGGMFNTNSSPSLTNVTFSSNQSQYGGGMRNEGSSHPALTNVVFNGNTATVDGGGMYNISSSNPSLSHVDFISNIATGSGGGMHNDSSSPILTDVTFSGNTAGANGGGVSNYRASPTLTNVTFSSNSATASGGGVYNSNSYGGLALTNVVLKGNSAADGGGVYNTNAGPALTNVIFSGNSASNSGGGMVNITNSTATMTNVEFVRNAASVGGAMVQNIGQMTMRNSIVWGNTPDQINNGPYSAATVTYSIMQGGYVGTGNLDTDPLFVVPVPSPAPSTGGNLHLFTGSPAINAGDPNTTGLPSTDLDGNPRIAGGRVDMGAYEGGVSPVIPTATPTPSAIIYVVPGGAGTQSGASWPNAKDLAAALTAASSGGELWVKAGVYKPTTTSDRTATFTLKTGVALYGGFAGTETQRSERNWQTNVTTLSGDIGTVNDASDNSYHVVVGNGVDGTAVLDGFSITGGNANDSAQGPNSGGGMYNTNSSPTLSNLTFSGNYGSFGGGMNNTQSAPMLTNVVFSGNSAGDGGGMYNYVSSQPTLINVVFSGNSAQYTGGGMSSINANGVSPTLTNVIFSGNSAGQRGGGMLNGPTCNSTLTNVVFSGNSASLGGAIYNFQSSPTIRNSIAWGDSGGEIVPSGNAIVTYSIVQGGYTGTGNLDADPLFVAPVPSPAPSSGGNLHIQAGSPAINAGDTYTTGLPITDLDGNPRIQGGRVDMGAYEGGVIVATPTATPTATNTPLPPTATPTATNTLPPPTATPTATNTLPPPTATPTATNTLPPPTATPTATNTPLPPTATPTATNTPLPPTATPTATNTPLPPTATPTATNTTLPPTATPTATATAAGATTVRFYASQGDGSVGYTSPTSFGNQCTQTGWTTGHNAASGTTANATNATNPNWVGVGCASGGLVGSANVNLSRGYLVFDTSALPDNAVISGASVYVYVTSKTLSKNDGNAFVSLVQGAQASTSSLTTADYNKAGNAITNPTEGSNRVTLSAIGAGAYAKWNLNASGLGWLSTTGPTKLALREGHDIVNAWPSFTAGQGNYISAYLSEQSGTSQDPYIEITYTLSP
ncbi:MAG: choice-of-anchor Q domain-containing protein [Anaerolineae bacterium]